MIPVTTDPDSFRSPDLKSAEFFSRLLAPINSKMIIEEVEEIRDRLELAQALKKLVDLSGEKDLRLDVSDLDSACVEIFWLEYVITHENAGEVLTFKSEVPDTNNLPNDVEALIVNCIPFKNRSIAYYGTAYLKSRVLESVTNLSVSNLQIRQVSVIDSTERNYHDFAEEARILTGIGISVRFERF